MGRKGVGYTQSICKGLIKRLINPLKRKNFDEFYRKNTSFANIQKFKGI